VQKIAANLLTIACAAESLSFGCSGAAEWQTSEQAILTLCTPATSFAQGNTHETKKVSKRDNNVFLNLLDA